MSANFNQKRKRKGSVSRFSAITSKKKNKKKKTNYNSLKAMLYQTHCSGGLHCLKDSLVSIFRWSILNAWKLWRVLGI